MKYAPAILRYDYISDLIDSKLIEFSNEVLNSISPSSVFVQESFIDWLYDMYYTDWDSAFYHYQSPNIWKVSLFSKKADAVVKGLLQYQKDFENDAYKEGYLPENSGVDVREWSNYLSLYIL